VKAATKKGYTAVLPADSINFIYPKSTKRWGRVGNQQANIPTLQVISKP
jgi:DNA (cytosine-5)-methyltransferase 1